MGQKFVCFSCQKHVGSSGRHFDVVKLFVWHVIIMVARIVVCKMFKSFISERIKKKYPFLGRKINDNFPQQPECHF